MATLTVTERIAKLKELEEKAAATMQDYGSFSLPNKEWADLLAYYCNNTLSIIAALQGEKGDS